MLSALLGPGEEGGDDQGDEGSAEEDGAGSASPEEVVLIYIYIY